MLSWQPASLSLPVLCCELVWTGRRQLPGQGLAAAAAVLH